MLVLQSFQIYIGGELYSFLGCSASGLKSRKCALWRGTAKEAAAVLEECGQFAALKTVSKRMARVGQLFSKVHCSGVELDKASQIRTKW